MATSYRGMYRLGASGKPSYVQVTSPSVHSIPLSIEEYESRGVLPNWHELPTEGNIKLYGWLTRSNKGYRLYQSSRCPRVCRTRLVRAYRNKWLATDSCGKVSTLILPMALFGDQVWSKLIAQSRRSLSKRELELIFSFRRSGF